MATALGTITSRCVDLAAGFQNPFQLLWREVCHICAAASLAVICMSCEQAQAFVTYVLCDVLYTYECVHSACCDDWQVTLGLTPASCSVQHMRTKSTRCST